MRTKTEIIQQRYNRYSYFYDLVETPMEILFGKWRKELTKYANGKVLEIGVGTGKNLRFYPNDVNLTAIDFSKRMISKAIKKWNHKENIKFSRIDIQDSSFEDNSFDTVLASYVFCSVPDPVKGLEEAKRICKPGGKIILLEHVRSEKKIIAFLMDLLNPLIVFVFGFNINRDTENNLRKAGINSYIVRYLLGDIFKLFIIRNNKAG